MNNLHIICENLEQRQDVFNSLDKMGLVPVDSHYDFLQVNAAINKEERKYMTVVGGDVWPDSEILTYQEFTDKYSMNQLKTKIEQVKTKLGVSTMQLSERLGKNPYYLYKVLNGVSTERQKELMLELEFVANGGQMHTGAGIAEMLENEREVSQSLRVDLSKANDENKRSLDLLKLAESQYQQLDEKLKTAQAENAEILKYKRKFYNMAKLNMALIILIIIYSILWWVV